MGYLYIIIVLIVILVYLWIRKKKPENMAEKIGDMLESNEIEGNEKNKKDAESD